MTQELDIKLKATNSSGEQTLALTFDDESTWFTLYGEYNGAYIQIDFDEISLYELKQCRDMMQIVIEEIELR